jgi:uncharacterized membrane protein
MTLVFLIFKLNKHKIANCAECSTIMLGELSKKYLDMTVELISNSQANHAFNLINRDQSTSIFKPTGYGYL